ncbi:MAG TPA: hypothetical protein VK737_08025 [Opitutales bacterium]|nr:hypothetical protein [Opitutales bacterium]
MKNCAFGVLLLTLMLVVSSPAATDAPGNTVSPAKPLVSNYSTAVTVSKSEDTAAQNLHFEVVVTARTGSFPPVVEGFLEVFDSKGLIVSCDVQTSSRGKTLVYDFDLSPSYLPKSRFSFKASSLAANGNAAADVVWFHLNDYVSPKGSL